MIARLMEIGIIVLVVAWGLGTAAGAVETTQGTASSDIVITDDVQAYYGPLVPGNPLYELKLALENLDEAFTLDTSEKVMKQVDHAEIRISEIKGLLFMNRSEEAERALDAYIEKMDLAAAGISSVPVRTSGIAEAYTQHVKHELVLYDLLQENPESTQLQQAYDHSLSLEEKFLEKSTVRIEKRLTQLNRVTARIVKISEKAGDSGQVRGSDTSITTVPTTSDHGKGKEKQVGKGGDTTPVTTMTTVPTGASDKNKGNGKEKGPK